MSWISRALDIEGVKDYLRRECPQAVPFLEALEANDYDAAAAIGEASGDVQDFLRQAEAELKVGADALVALLPADMPADIRARIVEQAEALPALAISKVKAGFPAITKALDDVIPEEAILKALRVIGAIP